MAKTTSPMTASRFSSILRTARLVLLLPSLPLPRVPEPVKLPVQPGTLSGVGQFSVHVVSPLLQFDPRVKDRRQNIYQEAGHEHGKNRKEGDHHNQRVVLPRYRRLKGVTNPRPLEDGLNDDRAADQVGRRKPINTTTGVRATRNPWTRLTRHSGRPLARAVLM